MTLIKLFLILIGFTATLNSTVVLAKESSKTKGMGCMEAGVRYGKCSTVVAIGLASTCPSEYDFVKPSRCNKDPDFDAGISVGVAEVKKAVSKNQ